MSIIIDIVLVTVGGFQASYSLLIPLIVGFFGLPTAKKVNDNTSVNMHKVISLYQKTLIFWGILDMAALYVLLCIIPLKYSGAYMFGCLWTFLTSIKKLGNNPMNMSDFCGTISRGYCQEDCEIVYDYLRKSNQSGIPD